ncbi:hypothetical protein D3C71_2200510 [compost metagenome]
MLRRGGRRKPHDVGQTAEVAGAHAGQMAQQLHAGGMREGLAQQGQVFFVQWFIQRRRGA